MCGRDVSNLPGPVFSTPVFGIFSPVFLLMCIQSAVCLDVLCWTSRLSEKGARSRASPVNRALWLGMADSCWPRPCTAAGSESDALPWHVWNDPAVVYCAAFVWFMLIYGGPPCNMHACVWIKESYFLHALSCVCAPLLCGRESGVLVGHRNEGISSLWNSLNFLLIFFFFPEENRVNAWITKSITSHSPTLPSCFPLLFFWLCY